MSDLSKLWFSQASFSAWLSCPLKFKYRYLDGLYWPVASGGTVGEHIELGRRFHLLAQRYFSGGPGEPPGDPVLTQWLNQLKEYLPLTDQCRYLPEYELRAAQDGIRLLAKYDLLVVGEEGVTIYDWKTDGKAPRSAQAKSPQTRLYLYLLSLTDYFALKPEDMQMIYWNPRFPREPLVIRYSREQQEADGRWARKLIAQILDTDAFPATLNERNCSFCEYRPVCHGQGIEGIEDDSMDWDTVNWDSVEEIALQGVLS